jgi:hypothetical protein
MWRQRFEPVAYARWIGYLAPSAKNDGQDRRRRTFDTHTLPPSSPNIHNPAPLPSSTPHTPISSSNNNRQRSHDQRPRHDGQQQYTAPRSGKLAAYDIMLRLEIPMEPDPERQDSDAEERGAERLAQVAEVRRGVVMRSGVGIGAG